MRMLSLMLSGFFTLGVGFLAPRFWHVRSHAPAAAVAAPTPVTPTVLLAAPGQIEAVSEEIKVGSNLSGRLQSVLVKEGDCVQRGQLLAVLQNDDLRAHLRAMHASAVLSRHLAARRRELLNDGLISREESEQAASDADVAAAHDEEALAEYQKTFIRAPLSGVILRRYLNPGESVTPPSNRDSTAVFSMADVSTLQVRMEVDESDVGKIQVGLPAYATTGAYPGKKFVGKVVQVSQVLGKKNIHTDDPTERLDTKVLECLVRLDAGPSLPLGLRVDVFVMPPAS